MRLELRESLNELTRRQGDCAPVALRLNEENARIYHNTCKKVAAWHKCVCPLFQDAPIGTHPTGERVQEEPISSSPCGGVFSENSVVAGAGSLLDLAVLRPRFQTSGTAS